MGAQRQALPPASEPGTTLPPEPNLAPGSNPTPASSEARAATSPARLLQARLADAFPVEATGEPLPLSPILRLAILLGAGCGLWVCLGGLAFVILR